MQMDGMQPTWKVLPHGRFRTGTGAASTIATVNALPTPLCPAGHLPRKGGDQQVAGRRGFHAGEHKPAVERRQGVGDWT